MNCLFGGLSLSFLVLFLFDTITSAALVFSMFVCLPHLKCGRCVAGVGSQSWKLINPLQGNSDISILNFIPCAGIFENFKFQMEVYKSPTRELGHFNFEFDSIGL